MIDIDFTSKEFWYKSSPLILAVLWFVFLDPIRTHIECDQYSCFICSQNILGHNIKKIFVARNNIRDISVEYYYDWFSFENHHNNNYSVFINTKDGKYYRGTKSQTKKEATRRANDLSKVIHKEHNINMKI